MDLWMRVGQVVLVAGLVLLGSAVVMSIGRVVGEYQVTVRPQRQTVDSLDLNGGTYAIWLEDHSSWPDDASDIHCSLLPTSARHLGVPAEERTFKDIEGVRCFLVRIFYDMSETNYQLELELDAWNVGEEGDTAHMFLLTHPADGVALMLGSGVIMTVIGAFVIVMRRWPEK